MFILYTDIYSCVYAIARYICHNVYALNPSRVIIKNENLHTYLNPLVIINGISLEILSLKLLC